MGDAAVSSKHGLYTKPNNTAEDGEKIGLGSLYANQNVQIIQSAKLSTGVTAYQFQINGRTIGWLDSRAFKM
ncbi:GW domain-containing glycosaminoglycan-binding protein [Enterococcus faecalis]|uniref:GW domain-containing glycosaminoglycan-binding protein n=1 Tax=Enterococcus faecalis TaxID=1351 RepID=UPI000F077A74|nr:GW domain-containing glycosaminoglycan-binding protein [Enterococcus faecalis]